MTFTSTHKEALSAAAHEFSMCTDSSLERCTEAVIRAYAEARGAKIVPTESTVKMDVAGSIHLRSNASDASGCFEAMLSASPDPFTDEAA